MHLMTTLFTMLSIIFPPNGPIVETGLLSQYAESPSIDTIHYRQSTGQIPTELPDNAVFIAVADCDQIGRQGLISINGSEWEPLYVFDCAGSSHAYNWLVDNGFLGEIDFFTAERHDVVCLCAIEDGRVIWLD